MLLSPFPPPQNPSFKESLKVSNFKGPSLGIGGGGTAPLLDPAQLSIHPSAFAELKSVLPLGISQSRMFLYLPPQRNVKADNGGNNVGF